MTTGTDFELAKMIQFMDQHDCPFCHIERNRIRAESELVVVFLDGFPITPGHTLERISKADF